MARGYSSRLFARAFFFADSTGSTLILVSCDFFAVPGGLTAMVSRRIGEKWSDRGVLIPPEAIIIAATHTHQGPGNYLTSASYNQYGSKYPGFDKRLLGFLADRIAEAIDSAISDGVTRGPVRLSIRHGDVSAGLLMNRSPATFLSNWNAQRIMDALNPRPTDCRPVLEQGEARANHWDAPGCPRLRAVDRNMTLLEVTRADGRVGLLVFFAVHPIVLQASAPFYNSDFVGQALSTLESESALESGRPEVIGFFNGAEGDVVPRRSRRDLRDVQRLGDTLLANIRNVLQQPATDLRVPTIVTRGATLRPGHVYGMAPWGGIGLSRSPLMGAAGLGGPEDDRTVFYGLGWRDGLSDVPGEGQGGKAGALDSPILGIRLTHLFAPDYAFPFELPVRYTEIGELKLASMPGELSTAAGRMLRDSLGAHGRFEIIGLANEYTSYVATPDEYEVHDYMGASTFWGPNEMRVLAWAAVCLARGAAAPPECRGLSRPDLTYVQQRRFSPGKTPGKIRGRNVAFGPSALGDALNEVDDGLGSLVRNAAGAPERNLPHFEWSERIRTDKEEFEAASQRSIRILVRAGDKWVTRRRAGTRLTDDDRGPNFLTLMRAAPGVNRSSREVRRWTAVWLAPILEDTSPSGEFRFQVVLTHKDGTVSAEFESCPFVVDLLPAQRAVAIPSAGTGCTR
jgi:Neutral/alkaline non-lysosomal ceramidase, N-terminal